MLSLWLIPNHQAYQELAQLITGLYSLDDSPRFCPHLTLLSGLSEPAEQLAPKLAAWAEAILPISLDFHPCGELEAHYRCLFLNKQANSKIDQLRAEAQTLFEHLELHPFVPQLSFLYGALPIFKEEAKDQSIPLHFDRLQLVHTAPRPNEWELLAEIKL
ncbi:haloacid dehalogenase [Saprospira sp. CCB-QB6]|uniref:2'-5' RNA ligase family protein n=1 Tax=Saprospira sp. CCB-QB6 TaxID=3023936 RepID=UPI002349E90A|nr:2'-5' RNA ligase family protein [Saprospira sp. CCB-QB6]WCL82295.1 haloacid dehalogenase [Saprospira sp. CCB-QB6]